MLVDTGGIEPKTDDVILSQMRRQAQLAIDTADVIILVVDMRTGPDSDRRRRGGDAAKERKADCAVC